MSMIEPGPVHTEFEMKMFADVSKKEYVGTDPETLHHFRTCYCPVQRTSSKAWAKHLKTLPRSEIMSVKVCSQLERSQ